MPEELFRVSHSKAESFRRCRKQYWFRYVSGDEWPESQPNAAGVVGTGIHRAMRVLCETGEPELGAHELSVYLRMPAHDCAGPGTEAHAHALEIFDRGCDAHASIQSEDRWAELDTWVHRPRSQVTLQTRIDRVDRLPGPHWQVIDWKTGAFDWDETTDSQLDIGHLAVRTVKRLDRDAEVTAVGWNLRTGRQRVRQLNRDDAARTVEKMVRLAEAMQRETEFAATPGPQCRFCDFRSRCPDARYVDSGELDWLDDDEPEAPDLDPATDA
ncbi:MAG: PD-(D/E)XK nuclease family protein [Dehalococcoidia bacterium]